MIQIDQISEYVPHGRKFCKIHPSTSKLMKNYGEFKTKNKLKEFWHLTASCEKDNIEDEVYVCESTVVWSRGWGNHMTVLKSITLSSEIKNVVWCSFGKQRTGQSCDKQESKRSLCAVEEELINVFMEGGSTYSCSLPFQVSHVLSIPGGLLLQRIISQPEMSQLKSKKIPTVFSLLSPLDEPRPVVLRFGDKVSYITDPTIHVVYASQDPPFVLTYDTVIGHHSIWILRDAGKEDYPEPLVSIDFPPEFGITSHHHPTPVLNLGAHSRLSVAASPSFTLHSQMHTPSPSGKTFVRQAQSPYISSPLPRWHSGMGHFQSPSQQSLGDSSFIAGLQSPDIFRSPAAVTGSSHDETYWDFMEPLAPEICLEHVWEEMTTVRHGSKGEASKAFLVTDIGGENYLCYLVPSLSKLRFVKFISGDRPNYIIFGTTFELPAIDAVPVKDLNMVLVLSPHHTLSLYSGKHKGCEVNLISVKEVSEATVTSSRIPGNSSMDISSEVMLLFPVQEERPSCHVEEMQVSDADRNLSVAEEESTKVHVTSLREPVGNRVVLVFNSNQMYRMTLPSLTSDSTVSSCLNAMKQVLPNEVALKVILKYYLLSKRCSLGRGTGEDWDCFCQSLFKLLGCNVDEGSSLEESILGIPTKKCKTDSDEAEESWQYLLDCDHTKNISLKTSGLSLPNTTNEHESRLQDNAFEQLPTNWDTNALLYQYLPTVVFALHLLLENLKLNRLTWRSAENLAGLLVNLARNLGWLSYVAYYLKEYPHLKWKYVPVVETEENMQQKKMLIPSFVTADPPDIYQWLNECLQGKQVEGFPIIPEVCQQIYDIIMVYSLCIPREDGSYNDDPESLFNRLLFHGQGYQFDIDGEQCKRCQSPADRMVLFMGEIGFTKDDLEALPFGVSIPLREAIHRCCIEPSFHLPPASYALIGREELAAQSRICEENVEYRCILKQVTEGEDVDDGMNFDCEVTNLRFSKDLRIREVRRLLQSAKPVQVSLVQKPEVSDHDFIQEQEARLLLICKRTLALSVGRGMFTLATSHPTLTEIVPIPPLEITGRALPRNSVISLDHVDVPTDMLVWPAFHNGVAAGLRIIPGISQIDSTWIVYHRPKDNLLTNEHAGFLMALGLTGHLANLATMNVHNYLSKGHELTSVGLLIGLAASKRGTMDLSTTKMLSIHIDALLPPTSAELDVPASVMSAALLGLGLVYQGTAHRLMTEVLLSEIGRPPGPEMENAHSRECYSLSAGLALGLVMLEHGRETVGVSELNISDYLYHYMVGGHKKPQTGTQKEKFKSPSYLIKEGDSVNINVTAPGAIVALGLIYLKSNNETVASWLSAPETPVLAEFVRPDFLLITMLCRGLIMWDHVHPSVAWIEAHIPKVVQKYAFKNSKEQNEGSDVDFQTISQTHVNIIAGCCLAMGLRFAGSSNQQAFAALIYYMKYFKELIKKPEADQAGKVILEQCLNTTLLALAVVMAGSGNLEVLRIARNLRKRHGPDITYGNHMAIHMAIGLLFLGGGRSTLSTSGPAIAALVCALFPQFPMTSSDNRCHLQALRHLYVLAVEPRLIVPRDVDTRVACYVPVEITLKETPFYPETVIKEMAPCLLPDVELIKQVAISGQRYWPIILDGDDLPQQLRSLLSKGGTVFVKKRIGQLPYDKDPKGYCNLLARTFTEQAEKVEIIRSFSSDPELILLTELFCQNTSITKKEKKSSKFLSSVLLECVSQETTPVMSTYVAMEEALQKVESSHDIRALWELKIVLTYYRSAHVRINCKSAGLKQLISADYITEVKSRLEKYFDSYTVKGTTELKTHFEYPNKNVSPELACFLTYHEIPEAAKLPPELKQENVSFETVVKKCQEFQMSFASIHRLTCLLQAS